MIYCYLDVLNILHEIHEIPASHSIYIPLQLWSAESSVIKRGNGESAIFMPFSSNELVLFGKSTPETTDFPMKIMGLSGSYFPLNQSIDFHVVFSVKPPLFSWVSNCHESQWTTDVKMPHFIIL